jgi:hypothetical protein
MICAIVWYGCGSRKQHLQAARCLIEKWLGEPTLPAPRSWTCVTAYFLLSISPLAATLGSPASRNQWARR